MPGRTPTEEEEKICGKIDHFDQMMQKNGSASREFVNVII